MPPSRRSTRPPAESGGRLVDPPVDAGAAGSISDLVDNNRLLRTALDTRIGDLPIWELSAAARRELLTVAAEYTGSYRFVDRPADVADWIARPLVMGGHQPELFHAGVWLKNFAIDAYARRLGGTAVNLVIDSDRCARTTVAVPVGSPAAAHVVQVAFDATAPETAWEERGVVDGECFHSFADRCTSVLRPLVPRPILTAWWPLARDRAAESHRLGLALAQARHLLEERLGLETLELPVSELVRLPTVMVFVGWLLAHGRRLHEAYNAALAAYRHDHRVRGRGRPLPDLVTRHVAGEEWIELPWWLWSREDPRRRRVFATMPAAAVLALSDLETVRVELPISPETSPSRWVDALSRMEEHGCRLRPRAIVTTLIARLLLADVFVHGIGGAAYDRVTDDVVRRLTGCDPPRHAVVSGTLRLPLESVFPGCAASDPHAELAAVRSSLRDVEFHPERHLPAEVLAQPGVREIVAEKRRWIDTAATPTLARRRCHAIRAANGMLSEHAAAERADLESRVAPLGLAARAREVLGSREYPWCFFPEKTLKDFLLLETG